MRRLALVAAAAACLALAAWIAPPPARVTEGAAAALGASLGGLRVLVIDALFLRAEALRIRGRADEMPALYETILDLDPDNDAAVDFLAAVYAYDLLQEEAAPEAKFAWWLAAHDLVERGLSAAPRSGRLLFRSYRLLAEVPSADFRAHVDERFPDRERTALARLLQTVRVTAALPKEGRTHLVAMTAYVPVKATEALAAGRPTAEVEEILAAGDETLRLRAVDMREVLAMPDSDVTLADALGTALRAVRAVRDALSGGDRAAARAAVAAYRDALGRGTPVTERLEALLVP